MSNTQYNPIIGFLGDNDPDNNWFGVTVFLPRAEAEELAKQHDVQLDTSRSVDADWYQTDALSTMSPEDQDLLKIERGDQTITVDDRHQQSLYNDDYIAVYSIGGCCEDAQRWQDGSGWICGRSTIADVTAFVSDEYESDVHNADNDATDQVAGWAGAWMQTADAYYTPESDEDEE